MWGPLKRKKDPQFPGNGGPKDPKLPKLVGTLLMITLPIHSLPAFIMWGRCSWKHLVLFQYLRVVLWLIGQGLLPEQSGKDVYRYIWTFPYRNFSNTAPLLYYGQFPTCMCQQNFHSPDILLQVLQWKNLMHNLWIDWRFVVVCFSFFRGLNSSS